MNCTESSELIIERAAGRLAGDRAAELAEHVEGCNNCRFELEATQWLARKLHGHDKRIAAGHVSISLLFGYMEDPEAFDEDAVESIWEHLDVCDACVDDYDYLKDLIAVPEEKRRAFARAIAESEESSATARGEADDSDSGAAREAAPSATAAPSGTRAKIGALEATQVTADPPDVPGAADPGPSAGPTDGHHVVIDAAESSGDESSATAPTSAGTGPSPAVEDAGPATAVENPPPAKPSTATSTSSKAAASERSRTNPSGAGSASAAGAGGSSKRASSKPISVPHHGSRARAKSTGKLGPVRDFFAGIASAIVSQPRNAAIAGSGIVIGLIVMFSLLNSAGVVGSSSVAHWETSEVFATTTPVQEVPIALVRRGRTRPVSADIDLSVISNLVIAVDLDLVDGAAMNYDAVILDPQSEEIFRDQIATAYFMEGRLLLRLQSKHFRSGEYGFIIDSTDRGGIVQTIARGTIYITR